MVVQVTIGSDANKVGEVTGAGFQVDYDQDALSFIDHQLGALFTPFSNIIGNNTYTPSPGEVDYSVAVFNVGSPPTNVADGEVVRLRFEVRDTASVGTTSLTLSDAQRSTSTNFSIPVSNLVDGSVTVSETRRGERASVAPGAISDGTEELQFVNSMLRLDYSSLNDETEVTATRILEPLGGSTVLPNGSDGQPLQRALTNYWALSQTGASSFTVDVCFALSDLMLPVADASVLDVYKRATQNSEWSDQTTELRPNASSPTKICALDVGSFSELTVTAPQGHSRTIEGTDGTGNDTGWRSLALPTSAPRLSLEDDFDFSVDSGALVQTYDGSQYVEVTDSKTTLERGEGFMLYVFDDAVDTVPGSGRTLDLPESDETQSTTVTVDGLGINDPFHFLGNPYDVEFSLDALAGGDLSAKGFQQSVQVWDPIPQPGQFDVITQGVADDTIAAWQSFFVQRASVGSGQTELTFDPAGRGGDAGSLRGAGQAGSPVAQAVMELSLEVTAQSEVIARDGVTVLFDGRATVGWDALEATQLAPPNASSYATLSSPLLRDEALVRRTLASEPYPSTGAPLSQPLSVRSVGTTGTATLRWPDADRGTLPAEWTVELIDTVADSTVNLRTSAYSFSLDEGTGEIDDPAAARFDLRITPSTIPVEMTGLTARYTEGAVHLRWQTASETNNAEFQVQRQTHASEQVSSRDASGEWKTIGRVDGAGTTSQPQTYRFTDRGLPYTADSLAYRLRQVDIDGTAHLSNVTRVHLSAPDKLSLEAPFPNPAPQQATLHFGTPAPTTVRIALYDLLGRRVATLLHDRVQAGRHAAPLSTTALAPGTYFVRLRAEGTTRTQKFTVVR